ncbi:MAG: helix-turn-helix domain-containing protein [Muribaculaceae bacterium]|nr:helix-turn-helix domain-containing protein [Muribaculaceae bacterium]
MTNLMVVDRQELAEELKRAFDEWRESFTPQCSNEKHQLLTPEQVLRILSISNTTLWRMAKNRELCPISVGGAKRYRLSDINAYIERR